MFLACDYHVIILTTATRTTTWEDPRLTLKTKDAPVSHIEVT